MKSTVSIQPLLGDATISIELRCENQEVNLEAAEEILDRISVMIEAFIKKPLNIKPDRQIIMTAYDQSSQSTRLSKVKYPSSMRAQEYKPITDVGCEEEIRHTRLAVIKFGLISKQKDESV